jgi:hypothetical protein
MGQQRVVQGVRVPAVRWVRVPDPTLDRLWDRATMQPSGARLNSAHTPHDV